MANLLPPGQVVVDAKVTSLFPVFSTGLHS